MSFMHLDQLFNQHGTDKGSKSGDAHGYAVVYESFLRPVQDEKFNLLELGIGGGQSLAAWLDYLPSATIVGVDQHHGKNYEQLTEHPRARLYQGDVTDPKLVQEEQFRIIIDDSDHALKTQIESLRLYWPRLEIGGYYVIEDLFVGDLPWGAEASKPSPWSFYQYQGFCRTSGPVKKHFPKHPQDIAFLNRSDLPDDICEILDQNSYYMPITGVSAGGRLHMMLVICKSP
jgi:hypothetical protein